MPTNWKKRITTKLCCLSLFAILSCRPAELQADIYGVGCPACPSDSCTDCSLQNLANQILPYAQQVLPSNVVGGSPTYVVRRNQVLFVYTYSSGSSSVTTYLPIKQFGSTGLYFYRKPDPGNLLGGWVPVKFTTFSSDQYWPIFFSQNKLPQLSRSEIQDIVNTFFPNVCDDCLRC
jgi:hypothetical protein